MTPAALDRRINGIVFNVYKNSATGKQYATQHDFSRFGAKALYRIRVRTKLGSLINQEKEGQ